MALWRCPHCGTPQPVTARCWVCRRSSTSCGTCRHFRASVAARIGYCGLDRDRKPLAGDEIRGCWVPAAPLMVDDEALPSRARARGRAVDRAASPPGVRARGVGLRTPRPPRATRGGDAAAAADDRRERLAGRRRHALGRPRGLTAGRPDGPVSGRVSPAHGQVGSASTALTVTSEPGGRSVPAAGCWPLTNQSSVAPASSSRRT